MELLVVIFVFYMLHIQFLLNYLWTGENEFVFFGWKFFYNYSNDIARQSLFYVLICLCVFFLCYKISYSKECINNKRYFIGDSIINITKLLYSYIILLLLYIIVMGKFSYHEIVLVREKINFLFELRVVPNLLFSYILFNSDSSEWKKNQYKKLKNVLIVYIILILLTQTRSLIFEIFSILSIRFMKSKNVRLKKQYILYLFIVSIIPNIVVLFRLEDGQVDFSNIDTYKSIFTYEYSLMFNNILSEIFNNEMNYNYSDMYNNLFILLIPSFLRKDFSLAIDGSALEEIANNAGVYGGGFSLLGQLYLLFGYWSILYWMISGLFLGVSFKKLYKRKNNSIYIATLPIIYIYIILSFRNGLDVYLKQIVQLYMIASFLNIIITTKYNLTKS